MARKSKKLKLSVYDVDKWLENLGTVDDRGNQYQCHSAPGGEFALVRGFSKALLFSREGIGQIVDYDGVAEILLSAASPGNIAIFPSQGIQFSIGEMVEDCPRSEDELIETFIRKFGSRLEMNFTAILKAIDQIGEQAEKYHDGFTRGKKEASHEG